MAAQKQSKKNLKTTKNKKILPVSARARRSASRSMAQPKLGRLYPPLAKQKSIVVTCHRCPLRPPKQQAFRQHQCPSRPGSSQLMMMLFLFRRGGPKGSAAAAAAARSAAPARRPPETTVHQSSYWLWGGVCQLLFSSSGEIRCQAVGTTNYHTSCDPYKTA